MDDTMAEGKKKRSLTYKENYIGWLYCAPIIIGILLFTFLPILMSLYSTVLDWSGYKSIFEAKVVGFKNFKNVFAGLYSKDYWLSIGNTLWLLLNIPVSMFLGLLLALAMNRKMAGAKVFRVLYYLPGITSVVAVTILFQKLFSSDGTINMMLASLGLAKQKWLSGDAMVKVTINLLLLWKGLGYSALMYLAGLQSVSKENLEAAAIDGAGSWRTFTSIIVPALYPITFYLLVTGIMNGLQIFNEPYILVKYGTAHNAMTGASFVYYHYEGNKLGVAAVGAWGLAVLVFIVTAIQMAVDNRKEKD